MSNREKAILRFIVMAGKEVTTRELLENLPEHKRDSMHRGLEILIKNGMLFLISA